MDFEGPVVTGLALVTERMCSKTLAEIAADSEAGGVGSLEWSLEIQRVHLMVL